MNRETMTLLERGKALHEVIAFYSYKGGTGRTMALANVACLLARYRTDGKRVLMIDWDLEAPGLHQYFPAPGESQLALCGVVELFTHLAEVSLTMPGGGDAKHDEKYAETLLSTLELEKFVHSTSVPNLALMPAGCLDES